MPEHDIGLQTSFSFGVKNHGDRTSEAKEGKTSFYADDSRLDVVKLISNWKDYTTMEDLKQILELVMVKKSSELQKLDFSSPSLSFRVIQSTVSTF